ncbi:MAG TPA: alpha/beta fold hydrolase [Thermomicrobiales bacterium]|nr:alpha/beta fold hydrolase [Thermomicrobiales bacterium]
MNADPVPHWHGYYDTDELGEICRAIQQDTVCSNGNQLHVRVYEQPLSNAPTVIVAHGLLGYGLSFARFHLPFWRRGWRVVQFDMPGMGESTGPRGAATVDEMIAAWHEMVAWTTARYDGPRFVAGNAEDGVLAYYALANDPAVAALSVHTFFEYGDAHAAGWVHPAAQRVIRPLFRLVERVHPRASLPGQWTIPWRHVFGGPHDAEYRKHLADDPLSLRRGRVSLGRSLITPRRPEVPFEACITPVQVIISRRNRIWPASPVRGSAERLGSPSEIIEIDAPHWETSRQFHDDYCVLVIAWFERWLTSE